MDNIIDSVTSVEMKTCDTCGETKETSKFPYNKNSKGVKTPRGYCYSCKNEKQKGKSSNIKEREAFLKRESTYENLQKRLWDSAKSRVEEAAKRGDKMPFTITPQDIIMNNYCPQLGMKLKVNRGSKTGLDNSYSLDKIIPSKGYVPGNIQVVSNLFNRLKSDAENTEQLTDLHKFYKNNGFLKD
jgi:hypothetical protein